MSPLSFVDPRDFRSFCMRGEGRANFVISAKCERTGVRIVWRFAKQRKSGNLTVKARSEVVSSYMSRLVAPFFSEHFLVSPRMVHFRVEDVHQLAKIPSLPSNLKIENFEELFAFPEETSFLPLKSVPKNCTRNKYGRAMMLKLTALEMLDATRIPKDLAIFHGPTITVEIKPKQGYLQHHTGFNLSHCNNCVLQIEKCSAEAFAAMYDFCPLDLYSGHLQRMRGSVEALLRNPHRNLRVFVNGAVVHSDEDALEVERLEATLFPQGGATLEDLVDALCCSLAGQSSPDVPNFGLSPQSVLGEILAAQKVDCIGIARAHELYSRLSPAVQAQLRERSTLSNRSLDILEKDDPRSLLEQYLLAATMKDCSVMVSLRLIPTELDAPENSIVVRSRHVCFAVSIKIVDLDPKSAKNLINAFERFASGAALLADTPGLRRPCLEAVNAE